MLVGMSFVLAFLTLVVISLKVLAHFAPVEEIQKATPKTTQAVSDKRLMAVISSAVHQYRQEHQSDKE